MRKLRLNDSHRMHDADTVVGCHTACDTASESDKAEYHLGHGG